MKRMPKLIAWMMAIVLLTMPVMAQSSEDSAEKAQVILEKMLDRQFDSLIEKMDASIAHLITAEALKTAWDAQLAVLGAFVSADEGTPLPDQGGVTLVQITLEHARGAQRLTVGFSADSRIVALTLQTLRVDVSESALPEGVTEIELTLFEGSDRALPAVITLPEGEGPFAGAVLVHGSGASDKDETIGANKPFRDLAHGLAERGIATIRHDKMPYAHPELFASDVTIDLEYGDATAEALRAFREHAALTDVFLIGHSLGGMLAPYLMDENAGAFAGGVILAGSPRKLWEISLSQNLAVLETLPAEQKAQYLPVIEAEKALAEGLLEMSDADLDVLTIFGMPARYLHALELIDAAALALALDAPFLILQGEADFQVSMEEDFSAWQARLDGARDVTFIAYPGLNHLFIESAGPGAGTIAEYDQPGRVSAAPLEDIAQWMRARAQSQS